VDSLVFDPSGNIVYSGISAGVLRIFNTTTMADSLIASGFNGPRDVALEPGGTTVLVSDTGNGRVSSRVDLASHNVSNLITGVSADGIAFDSSNRLYVVENRNTVAQVNTSTGAIIRSVVLNQDLDGLTFDSFTGKLYVTAFKRQCPLFHRPRARARWPRPSC